MGSPKLLIDQINYLLSRKRKIEKEKQALF